MPRFRLERKISPSEVTLDLLRRIERVLLDDIASRSVPSSKEAQPEYSIAIIDSFGTEVLRTIVDYRPLLLPNTTSGIVVQFQSPSRSSPEIAVKIAFHLTRENSVFEVDVTGDSARGVALGVEDRLRQILTPHRRLHGFLHLSFYNEAAKLGLILSTAAVLSIAIANSNTPLIILTVIVVILWHAHSFAGTLRPYTIFDSQRNRERTAVWKWLIYGMLGFVIFTMIAGTALAVFRKSLLGF